MSRLVRLSACSTLALSIASGPAFAELSAQQVWGGMEDALQGFGYSVTATETPTAEGMSVTDVVMKIAMPEENGSVSIGISEIVLTENADGSVKMTFPASMPITIDAAPEDEDDVLMVIDYASTGLEMVVSGEEANMVYTYGADEIALRLSELSINGEPVGPEEARFSFVLDGIAGSTAIATASGTQLSQSLSTESARYDFAFNDPNSDDSALVTGSMDQITIESTTSLPEGFNASDPASISAGGFSADGTLSYANGQTQFAVTEPSGATSGTTSTGSVSIGFAIDSASMAYELSTANQTFAISGPDMPVPVNVSMSEAGFLLEAPMGKSDTPQDMAFGVTLGGFQMSELLWNMVDPGAALPRDPATIAIDLTGQVTPFVNFYDPEEVEALEASGGIPGELNALTLNGLTIEAAGAKLAGSGAFTFDNTDLQTFGGFPRPNGQLDLSLDGANALIDKLIAMGLMTSEDAMGARMMMSMFAVPGDGPDNLKSTIQINEQGHVLANGMRIQ